MFESHNADISPQSWFTDFICGFLNSVCFLDWVKPLDQRQIVYIIEPKPEDTSSPFQKRIVRDLLSQL